MTFITKNPGRRAASLSDSDEEGRTREIADHSDQEGRRAEEILLAVDELKAASLLMPPHYWEILRLRDLEDKEFKQIAEILGISEGAARARHMHARHRLKEIVEEMRLTSHAR